MKVAGPEKMISGENLAEAQSALAEMEQQLEGMPEPQRQLIEQHLRPRMEKLEAMIQSGEM